MSELLWTHDVDLEDEQWCVVHFVGRESGETNIYTEMGYFYSRLRQMRKGEIV